MSEPIPEWIYRDVGEALGTHDRGFLTTFILLAGSRYLAPLLESVITRGDLAAADQQLLDWGERIGIPRWRCQAVLGTLRSEE